MDSPFSRLPELMVELVEEQKLPIPRPFMRVALSMMRRSVRKRAGFDIESVAPLDSVGSCFVPALFGGAFLPRMLAVWRVLIFIIFKAYNLYFQLACIHIICIANQCVHVVYNLCSL